MDLTITEGHIIRCRGTSQNLCMGWVSGKRAQEFGISKDSNNTVCLWSLLPKQLFPLPFFHRGQWLEDGPPEFYNPMLQFWSQRDIFSSASVLNFHWWDSVINTTWIQCHLGVQSLRSGQISQKVSTLDKWNKAPTPTQQPVERETIKKPTKKVFSLWQCHAKKKP